MASQDTPNRRQLYAQMCRIRYVEEAIGALWRRGLVSGEMHLGIGEEAVVAGVLAHVEDGDSLALDYRSTPALVARGVNLEALLLELLGSEEGLCRGRGGHMHLMSPEHLAAASGIVGAPAPLACGFGLAAQYAVSDRITVAFFGDGAMNEGMLMESLNLAAVWRLPVVFVCKDNRWAVTTRSSAVTAGGLRRRARGFALPVAKVDGNDVEAVWRTAQHAVQRARRGRGPSFLLVRCQRIEGHFLGDPLVRLVDAAGELAAEMRPLVVALREQPGAPISVRLRALATVGQKLGMVAIERAISRRDPLVRAAQRLPEEVTAHLRDTARAEVDTAVRSALARGGANADA